MTISFLLIIFGELLFVRKDFMISCITMTKIEYEKVTQKINLILLCKFCSNGTPILKLAVHSFWFSGTRFLLKTVRFSFIIVM